MGGERVLKEGAGTRQWGPSLEVQWLRRQASTARGVGSSPSRELRSHRPSGEAKTVKQNAKTNKFKKKNACERYRQIIKNSGGGKAKC